MTATPTRRRSGLLRVLIAAVLLTFVAAPFDADAQGKKRPGRGKPAAARKADKAKARQKPRPKRGSAKKRRQAKGEARVKVFDFTGLDLAGRLRTPQLIYFLDRAAQELELASLEKRSFIPEMVKSVDEESL